MKIEKSNNPAAAGALVLALVLIVGRIGWMLFGQNKPVSAASTVTASPTQAPSVTPPSVAAPPHTATAAPVSLVATTVRNPFTYSTPVRPAPSVARPGGVLHEREAEGPGDFRLMPLPPLPVQARKVDGGQEPSSLGLSVLSVHAGHGLLAQNGPEVSSGPNPLQTLKLTAIVSGTVPMAVLQTAHPEPVVLHVGDELEGMRVIAINEKEVVFERGGVQWTLSLQSAADNGAAGPVSVTAAAPEEKTDELQ